MKMASVLVMRGKRNALSGRADAKTQSAGKMRKFLLTRCFKLSTNLRPK
jgi:hypothetical protein